MLSVLFLSTSTAQRGYERTGYDGDFFSLEGAIDVFKRSNSIRDFERRLNTRDSWVNNLDLNLDGRTDYIRVEHKRRGDYHAIILQVPVSRRELQDVAVIEIEKTGRRRAMLQIVGDEYLYGEQVIVEPFEGDAYSGGYGGPNADYNFKRGFVNVYYWPSVRHILRRSYNPWISPYRYSYYPTWWSPWRQSRWDVFSPNIIVYNRYYQIVYVHRLRNVYNFYRPYRAYCPSVYQRANIVRVNRTNNRLSPSYSKTRTQQRARVQPARVNSTKKNNTGRRANVATKVDSPRSASRTNSSYQSKSKATSRVNRNQNAPTSRTQSPSKVNSKSSRSNSTYGSKSSTRTSRANTSSSRSRTNASSSRSNSRTRASSSSRSNRSSRANTSSNRSSSRASSRSNSRPSRSSSTRSSRSAKKSLPRITSSKKNKRG